MSVENAALLVRSVIINLTRKREERIGKGGIRGKGIKGGEI